MNIFKVNFLMDYLIVLVAIWVFQKLATLKTDKKLRGYAIILDWIGV